MLFDLQGRGRKRVVKFIYLWLAILMGGGLVLFGIGTGTEGGGLLDAFTGGGSDTSAQVSRAETRANRAVRRNPQDTEAWAALAKARFQTAGLGENYDSATNTFTEAGREKLETAVSAWERYLALEPRDPDPTIARFMAQAYSEVGLNRPGDAAAALEIVTEEDPSAAAYGQLATYAYLADQLRKGDLAAAKAVELAPEAQKKLVRRQLQDVKRQILQRRVEEAIGQSGAASGG
jgi:hypothetical protein